MTDLIIGRRGGLDVPIDPQDPEVLRCINAVRERIGWERLPAVPVSNPHDSCACVFGSTWGISAEPDEGVPFDGFGNRVRGDQEYAKVDLCCPTVELAEAINEVVNDGAKLVDVDVADQSPDLSVRIGETAKAIVRVPGSHPLMRWMWQFDHRKFQSLADMSLYGWYGTADNEKLHAQLASASAFVYPDDS